jgi:hypothetical protein
MGLLHAQRPGSFTAVLTQAIRHVHRPSAGQTRSRAAKHTEVSRLLLHGVF